MIKIKPQRLFWAVILISSTMGATGAAAQESQQLQGAEQVSYCLSQMFASPRDPQCFGDVEAKNTTSLVNTGEVKVVEDP